MIRPTARQIWNLETLPAVGPDQLRMMAWLVVAETRRLKGAPARSVALSKSRSPPKPGSPIPDRRILDPQIRDHRSRGLEPRVSEAGIAKSGITESRIPKAGIALCEIVLYDLE